MRKIDADNFKKALKEYQEYGEKEIKKWIKQKKYRNADRCSFMVESTKDIIKGLDKQPTLDDWTPIEKGLPPMDEDVFLTAYVEIRGGTCDGELKKLRVVGYRDGRDRWTLKPTSPVFGFDYGSFRNKVIAWQPLPDPYEGE